MRLAAPHQLPSGGQQPRRRSTDLESQVHEVRRWTPQTPPPVPRTPSARGAASAAAFSGSNRWPGAIDRSIASYCSSRASSPSTLRRMARLERSAFVTCPGGRGRRGEVTGCPGGRGRREGGGVMGAQVRSGCFGANLAREVGAAKDALAAHPVLDVAPAGRLQEGSDRAPRASRPSPRRGGPLRRLASCAALPLRTRVAVFAGQ